VTGAVTAGGVVYSEWIKLRSLRSTVWVLVLTVALMVAFPLLLATRVSYNPVDQSLFATHFATLTIGVLGVLVVTGEYTTGMIRATFCAVPRRLPVLWAKTAMFAGVVFVATLIAALAGFLAGQARFASGGVSLASPGALRAVTGTALFLTVMGVLGVGFGFLTRSTAGGITAVVSFTYLLSQGGDVLPASWQPHVVPYLPFQAGEAIYTVPPYPAYARELLGPWQGLAVLCGYAAASIAVACIALTRRDVTPGIGWRSRAGTLRRSLWSGRPRAGVPRAMPPAAAEPLSPVAVAPIAVAPVALAPVAVGSLTLAGVIRSEWIKFRSVRSVVIVCALTPLLIVSVGLIVAVSDSWNTMTAAQRAGFDPIGQSLLGVRNFAGFPVSVLGVLVITGEYTTGMIRATLCAVPRRLPVLWAKAAVFTPVVFTLTLAASLAAFLGAQDVFGVHGVSLAAPVAVRAVLGAALFLTVAGLLGMGIGALTRSTAGGIAAVVGLDVVASQLGALLPASWQPHVLPYLPGNAGRAVFATPPYGADMLRPWAGFALYCGYAAAAIAVGAVTLRRRDA
jgi:ABC-2 type transport system permease protein